MEAEDPLSNLADIHLPGEVSFWPPAIGWWILAVLLVIAAVLAYRFYVKRMIINRKLTFACKEIEAAYQQYQEKIAFESARNQAGLELLNTVNAILKRVALVHFPQQDVASLSGKRWLEFLDNGNTQRPFTNGAGQVLSDGIYRPSFDADVDELRNICLDWIRRLYLKGSPASGKDDSIKTDDSQQGLAA